jgi:hypothetical protein
LAAGAAGNDPEVPTTVREEIDLGAGGVLMSGLHRPTPARRVRELARRLAEEYVTVPLPEVSRVVYEAEATVVGPDRHFAGTPEGIPAVIEVIELVAREELDSRHGQTAVTPMPDDQAPRGALRRGSPRGAG